MKTAIRTAMAALLVLALCLVFLPAASAEQERRSYGGDVITCFQPLNTAARIEIPYKYALIELEKQFPERLYVQMGGTVVYERQPDGTLVPVHTEDGAEQGLDVRWVCAENYDEDLDTFHFLPELGDQTIADGAEPPMLTVAVLGKLEIPPPGLVFVDTDVDVPILGAVSTDGTPMLRGEPVSYYNGYTEHRLPAIRNQGNYGTCWAHSAIGAIETDLISDGLAGTDIDLSELHLAYFSYHSYTDEKNCNAGDTVTPGGDDFVKIGGNPEMAYRSLCNMVGPVAEGSAPYALGVEYAPTAEAGRADGVVQITGAYKISSADFNGVKAAILAHGSVSASMKADRSYYSAENNSFYCPDELNPDHAIMLVGWDDSFSRENFTGTCPENDGAWLVRNSWGVEGNSFFGYFWISYYDNVLNPAQRTSSRPGMVYAFDAQNWRYDHCYGYASIPVRSTFYSGCEGAWQDFSVDGPEEIRAVGIELMDASLHLELTLTCGDKSVSTVTDTGFPGYYLIPLGEPLLITQPSTVRLSYTFDSAGKVLIESATQYSWGNTVYDSACGSGGITLATGYKAPVDGRITLYTMDELLIDEASFPDAVFRDYVCDNCDTDHNGYLSRDELAAVTTINLSVLDSIDPETIDAELLAAAGGAAGDQPPESVPERGVSADLYETQAQAASLEGIALFFNLEELYCAGNRLAALDMSGNAELRTLDCSLNELCELNVRGCKKLAWLSCFGNRLTSLDVTENTALVKLFCGAVINGVDYGNQIETLDLSRNAALEVLYCCDNSLTGLNVGANTALKCLNCGSNSISELDISANTALRQLSLSDTRIQTLDLSQNGALSGLACQGSGIGTLDIRACPLLLELLSLAQRSVQEGTVSYRAGSGETARWLLYDEGSVLLRGTVHFNANGGYGAPASQTKTDDAVILPAVLPERENWIFLGWSENSGAATATWLPADSFTEDGDRTLFAVWAQPGLMLPDRLKELGREAFAGDSFSSVYIPAGTNSIDPLAFSGMTGLTIYGKAGSAAQTFADAQHILFVVVP